MPHNIYLHSSLMLEKKVDKYNVKEVKEKLVYYKSETGLSLFISFIINMCIISTFGYFKIHNNEGDDNTGLLDASSII